MTPISKGNHKFQQKATSGSLTSGDGFAPLRCFKCEWLGHHASECKSTSLTSFKCGKQGRHIDECKSAIMTYFNCGEPSHICTQFKRPRKALGVTQASGMVFALNAVKVSRSYNLI